MNNAQNTMQEGGTYRLHNQKGNGFRGLYSKLFKVLDGSREVGFSFLEPYELNHTYDGDDMIIRVSEPHESHVKLPKGITLINTFEYNPDEIT